VTRKIFSNTYDLFSQLGWLVGHTHNSEHSPAGEPDCRLVHRLGSGFIVAELKMPGEFPTWEQIQWLDAYSHLQVATYLWYPSDWDLINVLAQPVANLNYFPSSWWPLIAATPEAKAKILRAKQAWERKEAERAIAKRRSPTRGRRHSER